eukprot:g77612.t1
MAAPFSAPLPWQKGEKGPARPGSRVLSTTTVEFKALAQERGLTISSQDIESKIREYASKEPRALTIHDFMEFGRNREDFATCLHSAEFVFNQELPIRVSHMVKIMDNLPALFREMPNVAQGRYWYTQTMRDIFVMQQVLAESKGTKSQEERLRVLRLSIECAKGILARHASIVPLMAAGLHQLHAALRLREIPSFQRFLDDLFMSRIGHAAVHVAPHRAVRAVVDPTTARTHRPTGVFEERLDLRAMVMEAYEKAKVLCIDRYGDFPEIKVVMYEPEKTKVAGANTARAGEPERRLQWWEHVLGKKHEEKRHFAQVDSLYFSDIPSHLYHIVFELLKNSMVKKR